MMHILLDLDGIVFVNGELHPRFLEFKDWIGRGLHGVTVWSSHDDGKAISLLMGFCHLHKNSPEKPVADVLIDDCCLQFSYLCSVSKVYNSIDDFLDQMTREY